VHPMSAAFASESLIGVDGEQGVIGVGRPLRQPLATRMINVAVALAPAAQRAQPVDHAATFTIA
jgi:hypothetical protein